MEIRTRSAVHNPTAVELRAMAAAQETVRETEYGNLMVTTEVTARSKASTFINRGNDEYIATIGSANLNPRSLDDNDDQDSEMNIWWSGELRVTGLRDRLWDHHLNLSGSTFDVEVQWAERAWENLETIMHARDRSITGTVVRLDVVDRWNQL